MVKPVNQGAKEEGWDARAGYRLDAVADKRRGNETRWDGMVIMIAVVTNAIETFAHKGDFELQKRWASVIHNDNDVINLHDSVIFLILSFTGRQSGRPEHGRARARARQQAGWVRVNRLHPYHHPAPKAWPGNPLPFLSIPGTEACCVYSRVRQIWGRDSLMQNPTSSSQTMITSRTVRVFRGVRLQSRKPLSWGASSAWPWACSVI